MNENALTNEPPGDKAGRVVDENLKITLYQESKNVALKYASY